MYTYSNNPIYEETLKYRTIIENKGRLDFHNQEVNQIYHDMKHGKPHQKHIKTMTQKLKDIENDRKQLNLNYNMDPSLIREINQETILEYMNQKNKDLNGVRSVNCIESLLKEHEQKKLNKLQNEYKDYKKDQQIYIDNTKDVQTYKQKVLQPEIQEQQIKFTKKQAKEEDNNIHNIFKKMNQDIKISRNEKNLIYDYNNQFNIWDQDRQAQILKDQWNQQFNLLDEYEKKQTLQKFKQLDLDWKQEDKKKQIKNEIYSEIYYIAQKLNTVKLEGEDEKYSQDQSSVLQFIRDNYLSKELYQDDNDTSKKPDIPLKTFKEVKDSNNKKSQILFS